MVAAKPVTCYSVITTLLYSLTQILYTQYSISTPYNQYPICRTGDYIPTRQNALTCHKIIKRTATNGNSGCQFLSFSKSTACRTPYQASSIVMKIIVLTIIQTDSLKWINMQVAVDCMGGKNFFFSVPLQSCELAAQYYLTPMRQQ